jgi:hypothetical protein
MYNTIPEILRRQSVESLFETATLRNSWGTWKLKIQERLNGNYNENDIINLGDHLSEIFKSTGTGGREQGQLSGGGTAWESLICWYINLCTIGTRIVAVKKMSLVPKPIQDAITINYGSFPCNTESDITVIIFPNEGIYGHNIFDLNVLDNNGGQIQVHKKGKPTIELMNFLANRDFQKFEIGIIQCKTNWNDNAQIPMLWDMIYSAKGFPGRNISIGRNGYSISGINRFTYSFVTVPSNSKDQYKSSSVCVKRVTNLSGGNFWGKESVNDVARSIKEIFTNNYDSGFNTNIRNDIQSSLNELKNGTELNYFHL